MVDATEKPLLLEREGNLNKVACRAEAVVIWLQAFSREKRGSAMNKIEAVCLELKGENLLRDGSEIALLGIWK